MKTIESITEFFKEAFCADKAELATDEEVKKLKHSGVIKIITSDGRGIFYIARMVDQLTLLNHAEVDGWLDIHGGDTGAYWRGINPKTGKVEKLPDRYII